MTYNFIFGMHLENEYQSVLINEMQKKGHSVGKISVRIGNIPIEQGLGQYKIGDNVVLVIPSSPEKVLIAIDELKGYRRELTDLKVVVIIPNEETGSVFLNDLLKNGFFLCLRKQESAPAGLVRLVTEGRGYEEAERYYGLSNYGGGYVMQFTVNTGLAYMTKDLGAGESYADRLKWVKEHISGEDLTALVRKLPDNIIDEIEKSPGYDSLFSEVVNAARKIEAASLNKTMKNITGVGTEYDVEKGGLNLREVESRFRNEVGGALSRAVKKVLVGVSGTCDKIGSTHQSIMIARFLAVHGYKVALIEDDRNRNRSFYQIAEAYGKKIDDSGCFSFYGIDFYPEFVLKNLAFLNASGYQFCVIDFGELKASNIEDFNNCVKQIVICGAQVWNFDKIQDVFALSNDERQLSLYNYLFMSAPLADRKNIRNQMGVLNRVYFAKPYPDVFAIVDDDDMCYSVFGEYVEHVANERKGRKGGLIDSFKGFFK